MWRRLSLQLTGACLLLGALASCTRPAPAVVAAPAAPSALPPLSLGDGDGIAALRAQTRGKVTLVTFWATWCDACEAELPSLRRLALRAPEYGGEVVGVDVGEDAADVVAFTSRHRVGYRQLLDDDFHLLDALGGERRIPRTLVLDANGEIVYQGASFDPHALAAFRAALGGAVSPSAIP
jgi:thiol-disulfide isomerase/thioredoxin